MSLDWPRGSFCCSTWCCLFLVGYFTTLSAPRRHSALWYTEWFVGINEWMNAGGTSCVTINMVSEHLTHGTVRNHEYHQNYMCNSSQTLLQSFTTTQTPSITPCSLVDQCIFLFRWMMWMGESNHYGFFNVTPRSLVNRNKSCGKTLYFRLQFGPWCWRL
jgi:hypothetical protein